MIAEKAADLILTGAAERAGGAEAKAA